MDGEDKIKKAKESFETILLNDKYSNIIKDDKHLYLLFSGCLYGSTAMGRSIMGETVKDIA